MTIHAARKLALLTATALIGATGAQAQTTNDARIDALEAQLRQLQGEIQALRQSGAAPAAGPSAQAGIAPGVRSQPDDTGSASPARTASSADATRGPNRPASSASPTPTTAAVAKLDGGHPGFATADGRFTANLIGVMQFDAANYFQRSAGPLGSDFRRDATGSAARGRSLADGTDFRRARIGIGGKAFGDFEYNVLFDFGGSGGEDNGHVQELWLQYSGWKPAHIRVGAFPPFIGLEDAGSTNGMILLERPASADIARSVAGGDYREAAQIAFTGKNWFASGAVSGRLVYNTGIANNTAPYQSPLGFIGRAVFLPVKSADNIIHVGVHGSYVEHPANTGGPDAATYPVTFQERPELRVDGTRLIGTGGINALHAYTAGAEVALQHKNFFVQGEYERLGVERRNSPLADPHFHGFYVEGSWIITGQQRKYNDGNFAFDGPSVPGSFNPAKGNWGVWELAARYSDMDLNYRQGNYGGTIPLDGVRGGEQKIIAGGVNLYLNSIARIMVQYQHVTIDRISPVVATATTNTYLLPIGARGVDIGQSYNTIAARFQLAF